MSKEEDNKVVVGRWFTEFWGERVNLGVVDEVAAPAEMGEALARWLHHEGLVGPAKDRPVRWVVAPRRRTGTRILACAPPL